MVFEESTFVLPRAAAKVAPEPAEPAVPDPRAKPETVGAAAPAVTVKGPPIGELQMLRTKICRVHLPGCFAGRPITYRSRCSARQQNLCLQVHEAYPRMQKESFHLLGDREERGHHA